jgi:hypothetical protein
MIDGASRRRSACIAWHGMKEREKKLRQLISKQQTFNTFVCGK